MVKAPSGLRFGYVDAALTRGAAAEARSLLQSEHVSCNAGSEACELQWSFLASEKERRWKLAYPAAECPRICAFMDAAMRKVMPAKYKAIGLLGGGDRDHHTGDDTIEVPEASKKLGLGLRRLSAIVRRCAPGELNTIRFHRDNHEFCEEVWDGILDRTDHCPKMQYLCADNVYEVPEVPGLAHVIVRDARWRWSHGLPPIEHGERISISWRWYREDFRRWWLDPVNFEEAARTCPSAGESDMATRLLPFCLPPPPAPRPICQAIPPPPLPPEPPPKLREMSNEELQAHAGKLPAHGPPLVEGLQRSEVAVAVALAPFDAKAFGLEFLPMTAGDLLEVHYLAWTDKRWAFGAHLVDAGMNCSGRKGWFPAERVQRGAWGSALADFDGREYGAEYLSLATGEPIRLRTLGKELHRGWAFGTSVSGELCTRPGDRLIIREGWFPAEYWASSERMSAMLSHLRNPAP